MLDEELRILSGLQESYNKENLLLNLIEQEQVENNLKFLRETNSKREIFNHIDELEQTWKKYLSIFENINDIFLNDNKKILLEGIIDSKYPTIHKLFDISLNEFDNMIMFIQNNFKLLETEINSIKYLTETIKYNSIESFFATKDIDSSVGFNIKVFKNKDLSEFLGNSILYGSEITYLGENISLIRYNGQKLFLDIKKDNFDFLIQNAYLI